MAGVDQIVTSLQKLYAKRSALDKQIVTAEKKLIGEAKGAAKTTTKAKKPAAKKTTTKKKTASKSQAKK